VFICVSILRVHITHQEEKRCTSTHCPLAHGTHSDSVHLQLRSCFAVCTTTSTYIWARRGHCTQFRWVSWHSLQHVLPIDATAADTRNTTWISNPVDPATGRVHLFYEERYTAGHAVLAYEKRTVVLLDRRPEARQTRTLGRSTQLPGTQLYAR